jgi:adenylate kinase family enzyme
MRRILIVGSGGSGKSTLSRQLSSILGIEVIHLDALYWKPGWVGSDELEWRDKLRSVLDRDSGIMDGNYSKTLQERLEACDTVIFLDLPRVICIWRILGRLLRHYGSSRPDMPDGCPERLDFEFLRWVWNYPSRTRQRVLSLLEPHRESKRVVRLTKRQEVDGFIERLIPEARRTGRNGAG